MSLFSSFLYILLFIPFSISPFQSCLLNSCYGIMAVRLHHVFNHYPFLYVLPLPLHLLTCLLRTRYRSYVTLSLISFSRSTQLFNTHPGGFIVTYFLVSLLSGCILLTSLVLGLRLRLFRSFHLSSTPYLTLPFLILPSLFNIPFQKSSFALTFATHSDHYSSQHFRGHYFPYLPPFALPSADCYLVYPLWSHYRSTSVHSHDLSRKPLDAFIYCSVSHKTQKHKGGFSL